MAAKECREEKFKRENDPMRSRDLLEKWQAGAPVAVSNDDNFRLKWQGLFWCKPRQESFMMRIKSEGGRIQASQLAAVANTVQSLCEIEHISLTTRQGIQIRGIPGEKAEAALGMIEASGLTSESSGADNIRNITACPVDGLSAEAVMDARDLVSELRSTLLARREYKNLPRKFNVSVSGCGTYCTHPEIHDLGFVATPANGTPAGFQLYVGGVLGKHPFLAWDFGYHIPKERVIEVACAAIEVFIEHGCRTNRQKARLAHLIDEWGIERFRAEVVGRLSQALLERPMRPLVRGDSEHDHLESIIECEGGRQTLGVTVPNGRLSVGQARGLSSIASELGSGELRITHHQNLILSGIAPEQLGAARQRVVALGLPCGPSAFLSGLAACTGNENCKFGLVETKQRIAEVGSFLEAKFPNVDPLMVHLSACPNGCGHHQVADIGLTGRQRTVDGEKVEVFDVQLGGGTGPRAALARTVLDSVPGEELNGKLTFIVSSWLRLRRPGESFQNYCARHSTRELELIMTPWAGDADGALERFAKWHLSKSCLYRSGRGARA